MNLKLIQCEDWKAVHFKNRTILQSDKCIYPRDLWQILVTKIEVEPTEKAGHYRVVY